MTNADVLIYSESDLLVDCDQILEGVALALAKPGLVVPFSKFMAIEPRDSELVRQHRLAPADATSQQQCNDRQSIGAVNIISRETLALIGRWDESFEGAWFDDTAMNIAFSICCGPTRFVDGPGFHLYHLPGAYGEHLTEAVRVATPSK